MWSWFIETLRTYPEIAIFLSLAIGYYVGGKSYRGFSLGAVTATLLSAILIGQLGMTISANVKSVFFLIFLFAVGYGVGPQFVRGLAKDGIPQAIFSAVVCVLCLAAAYVAAKIAGYDLGYSAGLFAGAQTISASMGLANDAIVRLNLPADQTKEMLDAIPVAYAVTYIFGTIGSAIILAQIGPKIMGINLEAECKRYEAEMGGATQSSGQDDEGALWHQYLLRAYKVQEFSSEIGRTIVDVEHSIPGERFFVERIRRDGAIIETTPDTVIQPGDILAIFARQHVLVDRISHIIQEVEDTELLNIAEEGVDVYVTSKEIDGKTLKELSGTPAAHGIFLRTITRGATAVNIPVLPQTTIHRGDILKLVGTTREITAAAKTIGYIDKPSTVADVAFIGAAIAIGALIGAVVFKVGGVPLTLSTAGGALISGLVFGWLRSIHPTFGRIPSSTLWFMNSVGLNIFIAVVGISAGPSFVAGLKALGISLFLWGVFVTSVPLFLSMYIGRYIFRFDPALLFGICAGARTTTAALGMICERAKSQIPSLGYTVTYAVGNTLLTIWGMVIVILLS
ncbi:aspartate-alanine antiporter [Microvirga sp. W0021]|uniref:Aspartate-alanine antiporter n=1 Tax=Hohaiivirga grylli TaxID=3133970 RepID=A0ABV0BK69_9HYPH